MLRHYRGGTPCLMAFLPVLMTTRDERAPVSVLRVSLRAGRHVGQRRGVSVTSISVWADDARARADMLSVEIELVARVLLLSEALRRACPGARELDRSPVVLRIRHRHLEMKMVII